MQRHYPAWLRATYASALFVLCIAAIACALYSACGSKFSEIGIALIVTLASWMLWIVPGALFVWGFTFITGRLVPRRSHVLLAAGIPIAFGALVALAVLLDAIPCFSLAS